MSLDNTALISFESSSRNIYVSLDMLLSRGNMNLFHSTYCKLPCVRAQTKAEKRFNYYTTTWVNAV